MALRMDRTISAASYSEKCPSGDWVLATMRSKSSPPVHSSILKAIQYCHDELHYGYDQGCGYISPSVF